MTPEQILDLRRRAAKSCYLNDHAKDLIRVLLEDPDDEAPCMMIELLDIAERFARLRAIVEPLRALEDAATGPDWTVHGSGGIRMDGIRDSYAIYHGPVKVCRSPVGAGNGPEQQRDDFAMIVAARNALPALLREIQETP